MKNPVEFCAPKGFHQKCPRPNTRSGKKSPTQGSWSRGGPGKLLQVYHAFAPSGKPFLSYFGVLLQKLSFAEVPLPRGGHGGRSFKGVPGRPTPVGVKNLIVCFLGVGDHILARAFGALLGFLDRALDPRDMGHSCPPPSPRHH
jgi:hypothetical protein